MQNLLSTAGRPRSAVKYDWRLIVGVGIVIIGLIWAANQPWSPFKIELKKQNQLVSPAANKAEEKPAAENENQSDYWAVTLDTGQIFYGKLTNSDPYLVMSDAFYYQPGVRAEKGNIRIVKVGTELHQPQDEVHINRAHVIAKEQLTVDSKVVQAIEKYQPGQ